MRSIYAAIKPTLLDMLSSKKSLAALSLILVQAGASLLAWLRIGGWEVDQAAVDRIIALGVAYIVGQGIADHGVSAAKVNATATSNAMASLDASRDTKPMQVEVTL